MCADKGLECMMDVQVTVSLSSIHPAEKTDLELKLETVSVISSGRNIAEKVCAEIQNSTLDLIEILEYVCAG